MINIVTAVSRSYDHGPIIYRAVHGIIGRKGTIPWKIKEDMSYFKILTMDKPVVMGRKTYESIGKPLEGRQNIVVSRTGFKSEGCITVNSLFKALDIAGRLNEEVMVIGGEDIYSQVLDLNVPIRMYINVIDKDIPGDVVFPYFVPEEWEIEQHNIKQIDQPYSCDLHFFKMIRECE